MNKATYHITLVRLIRAWNVVSLTKLRTHNVFETYTDTVHKTFKITHLILLRVDDTDILPVSRTTASMESCIARFPAQLDF
jgi:hypothetical protein